MLNTNAIRNLLRQHSNTELMADLGLVHQGRMGYSDCKVSVGIDRRQGMYLVWISVVNQKNSAGRNTRVIQWPYGHNSAKDLDLVIADFRKLETTVGGPGRIDTRGWFARWLHKLFRTEHLDEYAFTSPLQQDAPDNVKVQATVMRWGGQMNASLAVGTPSRQPTRIDFPQAACVDIRRALEAFAARP